MIIREADFAVRVYDGRDLFFAAFLDKDYGGREGSRRAAETFVNNYIQQGIAENNASLAQR